jgi:hypothetical protein
MINLRGKRSAVCASLVACWLILPGNSNIRALELQENIHANRKAIDSEADRLFKVLNAEEIPKKVLLAGFVEYSDSSKNELVARLLRTIAPPAKGALLGRLLYIRTPENEKLMRTLFLTNLRSPDADARKMSLFGLKELGHTGLADLALLSMRDDSDRVLAMALEILLPGAKADRSQWAFLQAFYSAHKDMDAYHMSLSLLEAHGINK